MVLVELSLVLLGGCLLLLGCSLSFITCVTTITQAFHSSVQQTLQVKEKEFRTHHFPAEQAPLVVTTGHIALFEATVVLPLIMVFLHQEEKMMIDRVSWQVGGTLDFGLSTIDTFWALQLVSHPSVHVH